MATTIKPGQTDYPLLYLYSGGALSLADGDLTVTVKKNGVAQSPGAGVAAPTYVADGQRYQFTILIPSGGSYADDDVVTIIAEGLMGGLAFATTVAEYRVATSDFSDVAGQLTTLTSNLATLSIPTANQNADAMLDRVDGVETGLTPRQLLRLLLAVLVGISNATDPEAGTITFKRKDGATTALTTVFNEEGDRTSVTYGTLT